MLDEVAATATALAVTAAICSYRSSDSCDWLATSVLVDRDDRSMLMQTRCSTVDRRIDSNQRLLLQLVLESRACRRQMPQSRRQRSDNGDHRSGDVCRIADPDFPIEQPGAV